MSKFLRLISFTSVIFGSYNVDYELWALLIIDSRTMTFISVRNVAAFVPLWRVVAFTIKPCLLVSVRGFCLTNKLLLKSCNPKT